MEKINYRKQELDLVDRLLKIIESGSNPRQHVARVADSATGKQLEQLSRHGIRPLLKATKQDAEELIANYKAILAPRIP
jgi:hypothetical protein